jgi:AcrR family transcriptional regulator
LVVDAKSTRGLSWPIASRPLTTERAGERRQQLVAAALEVFGDRDYDEVSVDEVAEAAGVSHGLVFQYFGSKKGLYAACLQPLIEFFRARIEPDPDLPPVERLRSALRSYADLITEHPAGYRSLMTRGTGFSEVREGLERARWWRVERLAEGMGLDPARPVVRVGLRAWVGYVDAAMLTWLDHGAPDRDTLVEMLVRALGATAESIAAAE